jgi:hypothetical protein
MGGRVIDGSGPYFYSWLSANDSAAPSAKLRSRGSPPLPEINKSIRGAPHSMTALIDEPEVNNAENKKAR